MDNAVVSKKAYLVSLKHKLKKHLQLQSASANQVDRRWLNGFMAAGFHSGLISLSELKLEYMKAYRNAYGERMTEAQEQQLETDSQSCVRQSDMDLYDEADKHLTRFTKILEELAEANHLMDEDQLVDFIDDWSGAVYEQARDQWQIALGCRFSGKISESVGNSARFS